MAEWLQSSQGTMGLIEKYIEDKDKAINLAEKETQELEVKLNELKKKVGGKAKPSPALLKVSLV